MNNFQNNRNQVQRWNNANGPVRRPIQRRATGTLLANTPASSPVAPQFMATGTTAATAAPAYILRVTNNSAANVSNFSIFGANQYLTGNYGGGTWDANGNFTIQGVTIAAQFGQTVSYQQMLASSQQSVFTAGGVYVRNITGAGNQAAEPYTISTVNSDGSQYIQPISPLVAPTQFQTGITYNVQAFNINGMSKITWGFIAASTSFEVRIFPSGVIDPSLALNGQSPATQFGSPQVVGSLTNYQG